MECAHCVGGDHAVTQPARARDIASQLQTDTQKICKALTQLQDALFIASGETFHVVCEINQQILALSHKQRHYMRLKLKLN